MTLVRGGDEAGRDPTIEPADDTLSIVPQERDEFCWFSGSTVRMLIRVVTFFVTSIVVFMMFSSKSAVLCAYTMKTILLVTTDRSGKQRCRFLESRKAQQCLNLSSQTRSNMRWEGACASRKGKNYFLQLLEPSGRISLHCRLVGRPGRTRTCNPRIRNPMLYPLELRAH
jgi:hypothetical protein